MARWSGESCTRPPHRRRGHGGGRSPTAIFEIAPPRLATRRRARRRWRCSQKVGGGKVKLGGRCQEPRGAHGSSNLTTRSAPRRRKDEWLRRTHSLGSVTEAQRESNVWSTPMTAHRTTPPSSHSAARTTSNRFGEQCTARR